MKIKTLLSARGGAFCGTIPAFWHLKSHHLFIGFYMLNQLDTEGFSGVELEGCTNCNLY